MKLYTDAFYHGQRDGSLRSAEIIVPLVLELISPTTVVDVGCGVGTWLATFAANGVQEILGIDGDYVNRSLLQIPVEKFIAADLSKSFDIMRKFDLVVSLEVAEHLPPESAETFIDSLCKLGPCILFSAAIPFQGGSNHVNEQWPDYWLSYFTARRYLPVDCIRRRVWLNKALDNWYAQNVIMYASRAFLDANPRLQAEAARTDINQLSLVHPDQYLAKVLELEKDRSTESPQAT